MIGVNRVRATVVLSLKPCLLLAYAGGLDFCSRCGPALVTQFIVLFMDTSLASIIGMVDLTKVAQIVTRRDIRPFEMYSFIAVVYWICTYGMSLFSQWVERRMSPERKAPGRTLRQNLDAGPSPAVLAAGSPL